MNIFEILQQYIVCSYDVLVLGRAIRVSNQNTQRRIANGVLDEAKLSQHRKAIELIRTGESLLHSTDPSAIRPTRIALRTEAFRVRTGVTIRPLEYEMLVSKLWADLTLQETRLERDKLGRDFLDRLRFGEDKVESCPDS